MDIESKITNALQSAEATYHVERNHKKFVLSVKSGSNLIQILDRLFMSASLNLVPSATIHGSDAIPSIKIDGYLISPSVFKSQKEVKKDAQIYNFDYIVQKNS